MEALKGKIVLITGAGSETAKTIACNLSDAGARLILTDINYTSAQQLSNHIGSKAIAIQHDVTSEYSWLQVLETTSNSFGHLHMLIHCAKVAGCGSLMETPFSEWQKIQNVHCNGVFLGAKHAIPLFEASGGGLMINDIISDQLMKNDCSLTVNQEAVLELTRSINAYCRERGSKVYSHTLVCARQHQPKNTQKIAEMLICLATRHKENTFGLSFTEAEFDRLNA
ncbi:MAG: SDR family oxidoreductase [Pseudomonadales bacterium]|nr:SDR family oxidoreductase [Pseudomonadales bacterium]